MAAGRRSPQPRRRLRLRADAAHFGRRAASQDTLLFRATRRNDDAHFPRRLHNLLPAEPAFDDRRARFRRAAALYRRTGLMISAHRYHYASIAFR